MTELCWKDQFQYICGSTYSLVCTLSTVLHTGIKFLTHKRLGLESTVFVVVKN